MLQNIEASGAFSGLQKEQGVFYETTGFRDVLRGRRDIRKFRSLQRASINVLGASRGFQGRFSRIQKHFSDVLGSFCIRSIRSTTRVSMYWIGCQKISGPFLGVSGALYGVSECLMGISKGLMKS